MHTRYAPHFALLLASLVPWSSPASAQETDPGKVMSAASDRYAAVSSVCADFVQRLTVPLLGSDQESRGRLCQRSPNLFSMDFSTPEGDRVVADGSHFWIYFKSQSPGQVIQLPVDPSRGGMDFYREFLDSPLEKYDMALEGTEQVGDRSTSRILLTPFQDRGYRSARVWIDSSTHLIRRVEITEANGTVRRLTLSDVQLDPVVPASTFRFVVPQGVQVVSTGGLAAPSPRERRR